MAKQTSQDKVSRLNQMVLDTGDTWDLSDNDKDAIRHVLAENERMKALLIEVQNEAGLPTHGLGMVIPKHTLNRIDAFLA